MRVVVKQHVITLVTKNIKNPSVRLIITIGRDIMLFLPLLNMGVGQ